MHDFAVGGISFAGGVAVCALFGKMALAQVRKELAEAKALITELNSKLRGDANKVAQKL